MQKFWLLLVLAAASAVSGGFASAEQKGVLPVSGGVAFREGSVRCVESASVMRRQHMDFLLQQRDETMRSGIRTRDHSLKGCVDCHEDMERDNQGQLRKHEGQLIPSDTPIPVSDPENGFCQACHQYTAVNIDCFQCHVAISE
jgi:hypothetical protein